MRRFLDLDRAKRQSGIDGANRREGQHGTGQASDFVSRHLVEGLEHIDDLGEDQIGEEHLVYLPDQGGGATGHVGWITSEMADQKVEVDERSQRRDLVLACRWRFKTLDHVTPHPCQCCSTCATVVAMAKEISQRELRNNSGQIMRSLDRGESFVVTRNGVPVGELHPVRQRRWVDVDRVMAAFHGAPPIDPERFRADLDRWVDQGFAVRG